MCRNHDKSNKEGRECIPLKVPDTKESPVIDREKLKQMQHDDESLQKYWEKDDVVVRGQAETSFEVKGGVQFCTVSTSTLI